MIDLLLIIDFYENLLCQFPEFLDQTYSQQATDIKTVCITKLKSASQKYQEERKINSMTYFLMAIKDEKVTIAVLVDPRCEKNSIWSFLESLNAKLNEYLSNDNTSLNENQILQINSKIENFNREQEQLIFSLNKDQDIDTVDSDVQDEINEVINEEKNLNAEENKDHFWVRNFFIGFLILSVLLVSAFFYNFTLNAKDKFFQLKQYYTF